MMIGVGGALWGIPCWRRDSAAFTTMGQHLQWERYPFPRGQSTIATQEPQELANQLH